MNAKSIVNIGIVALSILAASVALAVIGLSGPGAVVHIPATTTTQVSAAPGRGQVIALRVICNYGGSDGYVGTVSTTTSNGVFLGSKGCYIVDQEDLNSYYFWSTNATDVSVVTCPRQ